MTGVRLSVPGRSAIDRMRTDRGRRGRFSGSFAWPGHCTEVRRGWERRSHPSAPLIGTLGCRRSGCRRAEVGANTRRRLRLPSVSVVPAP